MPQVATPQLLEIDVQITGSGASGVAYNVWHFKNLTTAPVAASGAISALTTFYTAFKPYYHTGTTAVVGYRVFDRSAVPWTFVPSVPTNVTGTGVGGFLAAQLTFNVAWRTATVGRSYRGRTFLGPCDSAAAAGGVWSGASAAAMQTAANNLISTSNASSDYRLVVYSAKHNTTADVVSAGTSTLMRTLRSRGA